MDLIVHNNDLILSLFKPPRELDVYYTVSLLIYCIYSIYRLKLGVS